MRYVSLVFRIALALAFGLGLLMATADDVLEPFDPYRPATLFSIVASHLHAVQSYVRDFRVSELLDTATAGFRERIRHGNPTQPPPQ
jgi:hypothetical protein